MKLLRRFIVESVKGALGPKTTQRIFADPFNHIRNIGFHSDSFVVIGNGKFNRDKFMSDEGRDIDRAYDIKHLSAEKYQSITNDLGVTRISGTTLLIMTPGDWGNRSDPSSTGQPGRASQGATRGRDEGRMRDSPP